MGSSVEAQPPHSLSPPLSSSESEEIQRLEYAPPFWHSSKRRLSKQLSMWAGGSKPRDMVWEKRIVMQQERRRNSNTAEDITDEDMKELKGCIELGFGFNEEQGQRLCTTLPALDLYFAVNRHFLTSPILSPASSGGSLTGSGSSYGSPSSDSDSFGFTNLKRNLVIVVSVRFLSLSTSNIWS